MRETPESTVLTTNTGCLSVHGIVIIKEKAAALLTGFAVSSSTYLIIANKFFSATFETWRGIRGAQAKLVASHSSLVVDISGVSLVKYGEQNDEVTGNVATSQWLQEFSRHNISLSTGCRILPRPICPLLYLADKLKTHSAEPRWRSIEDTQHVQYSLVSFSFFY